MAVQAAKRFKPIGWVISLGMLLFASFFISSVFVDWTQFHGIPETAAEWVHSLSFLLFLVLVYYVVWSLMYNADFGLGAKQSRIVSIFLALTLDAFLMCFSILVDSISTDYYLNAVVVFGILELTSFFSFSIVADGLSELQTYQAVSAELFTLLIFLLFLFAYVVFLFSVALFSERVVVSKLRSPGSRLMVYFGLILVILFSGVFFYGLTSFITPNNPLTVALGKRLDNPIWFLLVGDGLVIFLFVGLVVGFVEGFSIVGVLKAGKNMAQQLFNSGTGSGGAGIVLVGSGVVANVLTFLVIVWNIIAQEWDELLDVLPFESVLDLLLDLTTPFPPVFVLLVVIGFYIITGVFKFFSVGVGLNTLKKWFQLFESHLFRLSMVVGACTVILAEVLLEVMVLVQEGYEVFMPIDLTDLLELSLTTLIHVEVVGFVLGVVAFLVVYPLSVFKK